MVVASQRLLNFVRAKPQRSGDAVQKLREGPVQVAVLSNFHSWNCIVVTSLFTELYWQCGQINDSVQACKKLYALQWRDNESASSFLQKFNKSIGNCQLLNITLASRHSKRYVQNGALKQFLELHTWLWHHHFTPVYSWCLRNNRLKTFQFNKSIGDCQLLNITFSNAQKSASSPRSLNE